jgi:hypothetical protein
MIKLSVRPTIRAVRCSTCETRTHKNRPIGRLTPFILLACASWSQAEVVERRVGQQPAALTTGYEMAVQSSRTSWRCSHSTWSASCGRKAARSFCIPSRIRVLAVPRGIPSVSATCWADMP